MVKQKYNVQIFKNNIDTINSKSTFVKIKNQRLYEFEDIEDALDKTKELAKSDLLTFQKNTDSQAVIEIISSEFGYDLLVDGQTLFRYMVN